VEELTPAPVKPTVPVADLEKLDVRVGTRRMAGDVSEGMLFDIGYADGIRPALAVPERPVPNGARAG
jgi:hypothetical protein